MAIFGQDYNISSKAVENAVIHTERKRLVNIFSIINYFTDFVSSQSISMGATTGAEIACLIVLNNALSEGLEDKAACFQGLVAFSLVIVLTAFLHNLILAPPFEGLSSIFVFYCLRQAQRDGKIDQSFEGIITP